MASPNLVNNPSFEQISNCPARYGGIEEAEGWISLGFTPDLFHTCATDPRLGVPHNYFGTLYPAEGEGYAGLLLYHERSPLEYIATNLAPAMEKGEKYEVSLRISWARVYSNYACNNLGILFTNDMGLLQSGQDIVPDIRMDKINTDDKVWVTIAKTIVADDDYSFVVIGNFSGKEKTKKYQFQRTGYPGAYYYIDDIQVRRVVDPTDSDNFIKILGQVKDAQSQAPLAARIDYVLYDLNYRAFEETIPSTGNFEFSNMQRTESFYLEVKAEGYFSQRLRIENTDQAIVQADIALQAVAVGHSVVWPDIHFATGQSELRKSSGPSLKMLANFLQEHSDYRIEIAGHTDNQGEENANLELSQARANAVVNYLVEEGYISPKRLVARGYGSTQALAPNDTEENRQKNRRVEVKIIGE
ncbi:MAG: hypothetical protein OHK0053_29380 [Microscillaceae bacterium]